MSIRVLVQAGHVAPREPGPFQNQTGTTHEQEYALKVRADFLDIIASDKRFKAIPIPGDVPDGIKVDAFISIHGDGSNDPSRSGYCFGFPPYPVNARFAHLVAKRIDKIPGHPPHRQDNYTGNLAYYYGFKRVETLGPEILHEGGFLTNPGERQWMFANTRVIAYAYYAALVEYFGLKPYDVQRRLRYLRNWILRMRAKRKSWKWIKSQPYGKEYYNLGGK